MQLPYSWLRELSGATVDATEAARLLTRNGIAVEKIERVDQHMTGVIIARVEEVHAIEGAKIRRTAINTGKEILQVVCGAPNVAAGQLVAFAPVGATVAGPLTIGQAKIRGVDSFGMICSERELGLSDAHAGIIALEGEYPLGSSFAEALGYNDTILHFEITPNRGDCLSAFGIARELAAALGTQTPKLTDIVAASSQSFVRGNASAVPSVSIESAYDTSRFTVRLIEGITNGKSPAWMQQRLKRLGLRPISLAVDITNYVMHEMGNPMHAFDADRFGAPSFHIRRAKSGEKIRTLDDKERSLTPDLLVVADAQQSRALAGVMGGGTSEVHEGTTRILLEVAAFNPSVVRKGRKVVDLSTDASYRFERTVDVENLVRASNRAAQLFIELAGAKVVGEIVDAYPAKKSRSAVTLRVTRTNAILGSSLDQKEISNRLTRLGFGVEASGNDLKVITPSFRSDIEREVDLIEEVARVDGYDCIPEATRTKGPLFTPLHPSDLLDRTVRRALNGAGFDEMMGSGLADEKKGLLFRSGAKVRILNPVADDLNIMRDSLLVTAMEVLSHNLAQRNTALRLFEIGRVYYPGTDGTPDERQTLVLAVCGNELAHWRATGAEKERVIDFHDLASGLSAFSSSLQLPSISYQPSKLSWTEPGTGFELLIDGKSVGEAGRVRSKIADQFDIKLPVYLAQLDLSFFAEGLSERPTYKTLPQFPAAPRDIAMVVDEEITVGQITEQIKAVAQSLAEEITCFDLYRGKPIPAEKKSIAMRITYRKPDASLTSEVVELMQNKIIERLRQHLRAEIRDH